MKHFFSSRYWLAYLGLIINISFFLSAFLPNHWYDFFFFGSSLHYCCQGMDFYQIPNGAYAFAKGGTLWGNLPPGILPYSQGFISNYNVYHPLLTIILGSYFFLVSPADAFYVWMGVKLVINVLVFIFLFRWYRDNPFFQFAVFIFLVFFSQYNEIRVSQYQYIFNIFLLFFLHELTQKKQSKFFTGITYFGTLLVKPIGLLWIPVLFIRKKYSLLAIGLMLFAVSTLPFLYFHTGDYYLYNLTQNFFHPAPATTIDVMSLNALLHIRYGVSYVILKNIRWIFLAVIILLAFLKRISIPTLIYLLIVYFLFFYDRVYQYHFSVLAPILCMGILTTDSFQTKLSRLLAVIMAMPSIFFILRLTHVGYHFSKIFGPDPTWYGWSLVSTAQILPIAFLGGVLVYYELQSKSLATVPVKKQSHKNTHQ